jgi:quercetin dioxygenase-like cupin family protein
MNIIKLYSNADGKSYFTTVDCGNTTKHALGMYSKSFSATGVIFRDFEAGAIFDWHNAPQPQYIVYLEGQVEVEASGGEKRTFNPGDVLFATDLSGHGHITRTLTKGRSLIITTE